MMLSRQSHIWLSVSVLILAMSILDGFLTLYEVNVGLAHEANPLMRFVLEIHPSLFMSLKHVLLLSALALVYRLKDLRFARSLPVGIFVIYTGVLSLHGLGIYHAHHCSCWLEDGRINADMAFHINQHEYIDEVIKYQGD